MPFGGGGTAAGRRVAVIVKGWPRLSETFIAQEVLGLERRGLDQVIVSLRRPTDRAMHDLNRQVRAPVLYLPEYLHEEPVRVARAVAAALRRPGRGRALAAWLADLRRDPTRNRVRRFGQACVLAAELPPGVAWLHTHFLHTPASVARYAALLTGLPWSFSAHAKDIWTSPEWEKRAKLAECRWGVTCTAEGHAHLEALTPAPGRVELVYHGLDFARFPEPPQARPPRDGRDPADPVVLLSVGRAVEKKGFDTLLDALARLPDGLAWRWEHVGGGERLAALKERAAALGLAPRVTWLGAQAQDAVIARYAAADLFVLPSRRARDGDQDGLPNVLMEAQALALPCLATRMAAIPELIEDGTTGVLVPPDDPAALAAALAALIADPARRAALGRAGCARVRRDFGCDAGIDGLMARFTAGLAHATPDA
ncbi:glycosyltransferase [Azospirillum halopraeferens]|uniref:glycosyltransferase n=1 Tax=Azospirillum halopraeferens TaxID=34010 RepID=UPI000404041A|nr:glycosyltransferase [Azospirillum halopraeferens]